MEGQNQNSSDGSKEWLERLQKEIQDQKKEFQNLKKEIQDQKKEIQDQRKKIQDQQKEIQDQRKEIQEQRKEIQDQRKEIQDQKKEIQDQKEEIQEQRKEIQDQRKEIQDQRKEIQDQKKEIQDQKEEIQEQRKEIQDQKKEIQDQKNDKKKQLHEVLMNRPSSSLGEVGGSDNSDEREGEQKEDDREEEYIPSQHPTEAGKMFQSTKMNAPELIKCGLELSRRPLLEEDIKRDDYFYTLLEVIRNYCETEAQQHEFHEVLLDARRMFVRHLLTFLEDTFKKFLSQNVSEAIAAFHMDEGYILQLVEWCNNGGMPDEELTGRCIDVFNSVAELLAKMMGKAKFKYAFESLRRRCEQMEDQKRLSDCLTSLGIEEVFRGTSYPTGLCLSAAQRAKAYLTKADQIQCSLGINTGNSRAQCLAKLARCLAKEHNFDEAKGKVQQAIDIRLAQGEDDKVMLGATYNDQAVILSLEGKHQEAIKVREETLKIYKKKLGEHPFTATILNSLSNNYYALGKYDDAEKYSKEALDIRRKLLENHSDTAKSLFDLGMTYKMKEEFERARIYLEKCEDMQKRILDENDDDFTSTRDELEDVKRRLAEAEGQSNGSS